MSLSKEDSWRFEHMLEAIAGIEQCVARKQENDPLIEVATQKFIENVGEMARSITPEIKLAYPHIPWANIIGMRHKLVHEYYRIEKETLWDVAEHKIPALKDWIKGIIEQQKQ